MVRYEAEKYHAEDPVSVCLHVQSSSVDVETDFNLDADSQLALAELEVELDANTDGYHMNALLLDSLDKDKNCWLLALKSNGENWIIGKRLAAARLLWFLAQPVVCFVLFFIPSREELWSESVPAGLAVCMLVRETIYLLTTALCSYHNPAFLRVSIMASVRGKAASKEDSITAGASFVAMFLFAPDKLVAVALLPTLRRVDECGYRWATSAIGAALLLEVCSVAALGLALGASFDAGGSGMPALTAAHCFPAASLCCSALLCFWALDRDNDTTYNEVHQHAGGVALVAAGMAVCLQFPLVVMTGVVACFLAIMALQAGVKLSKGFGQFNDLQATAVIAGLPVVFVVFVLAGAGVMFEPAGSFDTCTYYYNVRRPPLECVCARLLRGVMNTGLQLFGVQQHRGGCAGL